MTPPEQEYLSRRYSAPRLAVLPLACGSVAIGEGFNPPELLHIARDWHDAAEWLEEYCAAHIAEDAAARDADQRRRLTPDFTLTLDLSNLELKL